MRRRKCEEKERKQSDMYILLARYLIVTSKINK